MESTRVSPERITVADEPAPAANDDGPRHSMEPSSGIEKEMRNEPGTSPATPADSEPLETLRQAIRAEVAAQTIGLLGPISRRDGSAADRAEESDPECLMSLARHLGLDTLRLGRTTPDAAAA